MTTTLRSASTLALVHGLVNAIVQDSKPEAGGFDLEAGMVGRGVSEWLRSVAAQLDQNAVTMARTYGVLSVLDGYSVFDVSGTEVDETFVNAKKESVALLSDIVRGTSFPTAAVLDAVESSVMITKMRSRGDVLSVWSVEDLEFIGDEEETNELTDQQLEMLKTHLLNECGGGLVDRLAEAGNDALATYWQMHKSALVARVIAASAPDEEVESPQASPADVLRGG